VVLARVEHVEDVVFDDSPLDTDRAEWSELGVARGDIDHLVQRGDAFDSIGGEDGDLCAVSGSYYEVVGSLVVSDEDTVDVSLEVEFLDCFCLDVDNKDKAPLVVAVPGGHDALEGPEGLVLIEDVGVVERGDKLVADEVVEIHIRILVGLALVEV
jgi:hypothetical protein